MRSRVIYIYTRALCLWPSIRFARARAPFRFESRHTHSWPRVASDGWTEPVRPSIRSAEGSRSLTSIRERRRGQIILVSMQGSNLRRFGSFVRSASWLAARSAAFCCARHCRRRQSDGRRLVDILDDDADDAWRQCESRNRPGASSRRSATRSKLADDADEEPHYGTYLGICQLPPAATAPAPVPVPEIEERGSAARTRRKFSLR